MPTLKSAAKYLVKTYGFAPIYNDDEMFDDPIVSASEQGTFEALHLLASLATDSDTRLVNVKRVTEWLGKKSRAANAR